MMTPIKVFIADDSDPIRENLRELLSEVEEILVVGEADNVNEACNEILHLKPDVVILDIHMPGGSGFDVLREIKEKLPEINMIVLTNYPTTQYRLKCLELGASQFLDKHKEIIKVPGILLRCHNALRTPEIQTES